LVATDVEIGLIAKTDADLGGTEMNHALLSTFELGKGHKGLLGRSGGEDQLADVLLITDGDIWNVEQVIASAKSSGHRVFAIGVGSAPSESLLREVAEKSGGACELVSPGQDVASVIVRMSRRMRSNRCSNLSMAWGCDALWQSHLPKALYAGDTIHLCARIAARPQTTTVLSWEASGINLDSGATQVQVLDGDCLSRMVASNQIGELSEQIGQIRGQKELADEGATSQVLMKQALELALKYQLVTDQTNLLLVHVRKEGVKAEGLPDLEKVAHMQAAGWGGECGSTSRSGLIQQKGARCHQQYQTRLPHPLAPTRSTSVGVRSGSNRFTI